MARAPFVAATGRHLSRLARTLSRRRRHRGGAGPPARPQPVQIVVTPGSGSGRAMMTARRLTRLLRRRGVETHIRTFDDLTALRRWADTCEAGFSHLICIGGDATLSNAALASVRTKVPFLPVPNGFGNLFARVFGFPDRAEAVVGLLETGEVRRVDVGIAEGKAGPEPFLSHRSYGLLEQIQEAAERGRRQPRRRFLRHLWYYGVAYRFLFRSRLSSYAVEVDGTTVADDAVLVTVANVETYGGFLPLTPTASPIDGRFDVAVLPRVSKTALMTRLFRALLRLPPGRRKPLAIHRGRRVVVTTPRRRDQLTLWRQALPLLVPPGAIEELRRRTVEDGGP
jgi:diacylglycerol kinase (ATP)